MASAPMQAFSFAGDQCTAAIAYDTVSLQVQTVTYKNLTAQDGAVAVNGPSGFAKTYILKAGTGTTVMDVSGDHVQLTSRQGTDKLGNPVTIVEWPAGWSMQARWPA